MPFSDVPQCVRGVAVEEDRHVRYVRTSGLTFLTLSALGPTPRGEESEKGVAGGFLYLLLPSFFAPLQERGPRRTSRTSPYETAKRI